MTRKAHRRKLTDPLVPISGDRLKQARDRAGHTWRGIAKELGRRGVPAAYQTLTYVEKGQQRRVRRSVFDALVRLLRKPFNRSGYAKWLAGENVAPWGGPTRTHEWAPLVGFTVETDVEELRAVAIRERPDRETAEPWHPLHLSGQLRGLYNPRTWRDSLMQEPPLATAAELEAAAEHGSAFLRLILRPWIEGRATFRRDARRRLLATLGRLLRART